MTTAKGFSISLLMAAAAMLSQSAIAADQIHQRASDSGSVELSNLDDSDASVNVVNAEKPATAFTPPALTKPVLARRAKAKSATGTGDNESADANADEQSQTADSTETGADSTPASTNVQAQPEQREMQATATGGSFSGGGYAGAGSTGGNAVSAGGAYVAGTGGNVVYSNTSNSPDTTGVNPGTFSSPAAGATPATTTPRVAAAGVASQAGVDPALAGQLTQYRALMLQEANFNALTNLNPATSRRYLAVDRTTYQTRIGQ